MTRKELINVIENSEVKATCLHYDCDGYEINCRKCAEEVLAAYEKQIREKAFDDGIAKIEEMLSRVFNDEDDYYLGIENGYQDCIRELEQLKEQK